MDDDATASAPLELDGYWAVLRGVVSGIFEGLLRWRPSVRDVEHVPATGGAVVTWNHHSYTDFLFVALAVVRDRGRPVRILGKAEIWDNPFTRFWALRAGAVPVFRSRAGGGREALRAAIAALENGDLVMVAPEETISQSFELLPFARGAAIMAIAADVPVVPAASWGSQRFWTKGRSASLVTGIPVTTAFGAPIVPAEGEDADALTARVRTATEELLHELQRDYPDAPEPGDDWWLPRRLGGTAPDHAGVLAEHERWRSRRIADRRG
ncbi:lysophospholipid acyltransferase family protein [Salsipaludibacter albus]|uniref:lysophospholipid acyltransferase family protein n=1 Tax=Salsipaludibacter albus TaxID=2849650 RepID=UPI001EE4B500|nr:lysophospholipid acyltransferase family protein [Salsipaludibacter albus]MBY5164243.1 1-acyl-sn-glycerol-3-phosphate acyltransferase [Salsipaludibacter albus]